MVIAGTYAEFVLPLLIVVGLFTRLASLGKIGFTLLQSYVDIAFHGAEAATIGAWFDNLPNATILDQRALWVFLLVTLVVKGAGVVSLDVLLAPRRRPSHRPNHHHPDCHHGLPPSSRTTAAVAAPDYSGRARI